MLEHPPPHPDLVTSTENCLKVEECDLDFGKEEWLFASTVESRQRVKLLKIMSQDVS